MTLLDKIKSIDQFGALFQLSIYGDNPQYKSIAGASATFFIYSSALVYLIYLCYLWFADLCIPFVASGSVYKSEGSTFYLNEVPFTFNVEMYTNESFRNYHGKYFYNVSRIFFINDSTLEFDQYHPKCEKLYFMDLIDEPICIDLTDPSNFFQKQFYQDQRKLTQLASNRLYDDYLGFYFNPCDNSDPNCISEESAQPFLENTEAEYRLTLMRQEYELDKKEIITIPFDFYFPLSFTQQNVFNLVLTPTKLKVIRGIFFPTEFEYEYISKVDVKPIPNQRPAEGPYVIIWVSLDRSETQTKIEYPRLPQILAQFSSLHSALMGIGILFNLINGKILMKKLVNQIGEIYFFEFAVKNVLMKINKKSDQIEEIRSQLQNKCNFLNIIYEISRLQFAIQTILNRQQLAQIQRMRYTISDDDSMKSDETILTEKNFEVFTMNRKLEDDNNNTDTPNLHNLGNHIQGVIKQNLQPHHQQFGYIIDLSSPVSWFVRKKAEKQQSKIIKIFPQDQ